MARLILETPGGGPHSGQTLVLPSQQAKYRGARGRGRRGRRSEEGAGERRKRERGKERAVHDTPPPTRRDSSWHREVQPARVEREDPEEEKDTKGEEEGEDEDGETPRGAPVEVT